MTDEKQAEAYVSRMKKCFTALKILIGLAVACIVVLAVFAAVAVGTDMYKNNISAALLGLTIPMLCAAVFFCGGVAVLLTAKITLNKLKKLGGIAENPPENSKETADRDTSDEKGGIIE